MSLFFMAQARSPFSPGRPTRPPPLLAPRARCHTVPTTARLCWPRVLPVAGSLPLALPRTACQATPDWTSRPSLPPHGAARTRPHPLPSLASIQGHCAALLHGPFPPKNATGTPLPRADAVVRSSAGARHRASQNRPNHYCFNLPR
jgi:hypothetical protein